MYNTIKSFPKQFTESIEVVNNTDIALPASVDKYRLYLAGMGGSALPADLINDYLEGIVKLNVIRNYDLPPDVSEDSIVICSSFSGNTEETLSAYNDAIKKGAHIIAMSNGGRLEKRAVEDGISFVKIPDCIQPRCATGYFFTSIMMILFKLGLIEDPCDKLTGLSSFLERELQECEDNGKNLANSLEEKVPIIYGTSDFYSVARIWKIKMNENSKIQSFFNVFPELNHNEMVGYTKKLMSGVIILLKNKGMHPRNKKRMEIMEDILSDQYDFFSIKLKGDDYLKNMFHALLIADFTTYYLAKKYGIDPAPVDMVEDFKKMMG